MTNCREIEEYTNSSEQQNNVVATGWQWTEATRVNIYGLHGEIFEQQFIHQFEKQYGKRLDDGELIEYSELRSFFGSVFRFQRQKCHTILKEIAEECKIKREKRGIKRITN